MYDIDLNRYTEVVDSAIALRPQIEKAVDEICAQGYSNLFFIGCGLASMALYALAYPADKKRFPNLYPKGVF